MSGIQALGGAQTIAPLYEFGASQSCCETATTTDTKETTSSVTNEEGQTLLDIKDQLEAAVAEALEGLGDGDPREAIRDAIDSTLEENGFDLEEVRAAMDHGPRGPGRMGPPPEGPPPEGPPPGEPPAEGDASSEGSTLSTSDAAESFVERFLAQFRAGTSVDELG